MLDRQQGLISESLDPGNIMQVYFILGTYSYLSQNLFHFKAETMRFYCWDTPRFRGSIAKLWELRVTCRVGGCRPGNSKNR